VVNAIRRIKARRTAPAYRAIVDAGPSTASLVMSGAVALVVVVGLYAIGVHDRTLLIAVPLVAFIVACLADRDGWRVRMATAELAALQRNRWTQGTLPTDPISAEAWLQANPEAPGSYRSAAMVTAGRLPEARAMIDAAVAQTPEEALQIARLRLTIDARLGETALDRQGVEAFLRMPELSMVTEAERRYQRLSLAWSEAWILIHAGRTWRGGFLSSLRSLEPFNPPIRYVAFHAIQQFALPIAYGLAWLIVSSLGLTDWLP
jgi:hypothetical protein